MRPDNITWVVNPFYFHASTNIINLDWEHDQYEWINPKDIENYDTVPKLKEALDKGVSSPLIVLLIMTKTPNDDDVLKNEIVCSSPDLRLRIFSSPNKHMFMEQGMTLVQIQ